MVINYISIMLAIIVGICLYSGLYHLKIGLDKKKNLKHLAFGILCLIVLCYSIGQIYRYQITVVSELQLLFKWQNILAQVFFGVLAWFIAYYTKVKPLRLLIIYSTFILIIITIIILSPKELLFIKKEGIINLELPLGHYISYYTDTLTPWNNILFRISVIIYIFAYYACYKQFKRGEKSQALRLGLSLTIILVAVVFDSQFLAYGRVKFIFISEFGYISLIIVMSLTLIRERIIIEENLEVSEALLSGIFDLAEEAIIAFDEEQNVVLYNKGAERIFKYSSEESIGKSIDKFIPHNYVEQHSKYFSDFTYGDTSARYMKNRNEILGRRKNGDIFPSEASILKLKSEGKIISTVILRDISEQKRSEDELRKALYEIKELKNKIEEEKNYLQSEIKSQHNFSEIIGQSSILKSALSLVEQVATSDSNVLILGESGTGKELIARAVHDRSRRRNSTLVKVNCSALPFNLIESELFGHEKGAFTGAHSRRIGRFEIAHSGTLFLDEIGDLPLDVQVKLLRVLQEGEIQRLGSNENIKIDARVIAATNRDLIELVKNGSFREDLYFRLNVFPIYIPPLRERKDDIPLLVNHFIAKNNKKLGKQIEQVPTRVIKALQAYNWPGNIRELENIIERAMIICKSDKLELNERILSSTAEIEGHYTLHDLERHHILKTLEKTMWRVSGKGGAAEMLGIKPTTLEARMKNLGIQRPK